MWTVERIVHFEPGDFLVDGVSHFGFRDRRGRLHAVDHQRHVVARVGPDGTAEWTVAAEPQLAGVPNVEAELEFPMYVDVLPDETVLVSNFECARLYRIDPVRLSAELLVDGKALGLVDMGNCVVDGEGYVWVNEVRGCRVWRFDPAGRPVLTLGDGVAGFEPGPVSFERARFGWIYDLRLGPDGVIYVLDSGNFAVRAVDPVARVVSTVAGNGRPGADGDGGDARAAAFGGDPEARFDGPISLALDEPGNVFVGDRFNGAVRMVEHDTGTISTIAGLGLTDDDAANNPGEREPLRLRLPQVSSMDYSRGRLYVPTDLADDAGDLAILRRA
jgi:hypothetical protein